MKLSIFIPLYNEENLIVQLLERLNKIDFPFVSSVEIVVTDDCSSDQSYQRAKDFISEKYTLTVIRHEKNGGKGAAVKTCAMHAKGDLFLVQDADLELIPEDIPSMLLALEKTKVEFINGSRYMPGIIRPLYSYRRYFANKLFTYIVSILINIRLTDLACGYKLLTRKLWEEINLNENRFGFEAELIIKAMRIRKNNIAEVPVHYFPRNRGEGKKLRNTDGIKILYTILKYGLLRKK